MAWIKNIEHEKCLAVTDEVSYQPGQIVSKTLAQTRHHSLTLFAFDQGEAISTHESGGDAMVLGLDGQGVITIDGREHLVHAGEAIVMPAKKAARGVGNGALQNAAYRPISGGGVTMKVKIDRDGCIGCGFAPPPARRCSAWRTMGWRRWRPRRRRMSRTARRKPPTTVRFR